jgi:ribosomal protein L40E
MHMLGAPEPPAGSEIDKTTARCPECGGLNPLDAQWCGQCHALFETAEDDSEPATVEDEPGPSGDEFASWLELLEESERPEPATEVAVDDWAAESPSDDFDPLTDPFLADRRAVPGPAPTGEDQPSRTGQPAPVHQRIEHRAGAFAVSGDRISWTCSRCDADNPLQANACSVCGTAFAEVVGPPPEPRVARDPNMAAFASLFYPGAGHAYLGMWGQAVARAALSTWVLGVVIFALLANGVPGATLIGIVFGIVSLALWGVAAHDAFREATDQGDLVILKPRAFLYVTIVLLFVLFASLVMAGFSVSRNA